ncbi:MAG: hypothetical protein WCD42_02845 [Rhizomicrobium sp.]
MMVKSYTHAVGDSRDIHPNLLRLAQHFTRHAKQGFMPRRDAFQQDELSWLYGYYYVVDVLEDGRDYRFGYCGHCWQLFYGMDLTGERLSEVESYPHLKGRRADYDAVIHARHPAYAVGILQWPGGSQAHFHRIIIPFANEHGAPSMLLVAAQSEIAPSQLLENKVHGNPRILVEEQGWPSAIQSQLSSDNIAMRPI